MRGKFAETFFNITERNIGRSKHKMIKEPTKEKFEYLECLKVKIVCMARPV